MYCRTVILYALNSQENNWQSDATNSNTSALPPGLLEGETAIALNEIDNAIYTGITSGSRMELLSAISDRTNWTGSNSTRQTMPSGNFNVTGSSGGNGDVWLNEIHYDNTGSDTNEGFEVAGVAGTNLSDWTIELYNGNGGGIYDTISLSGTLSDQDSGFGTKFFASSGVQNGFDALALVHNGTLVQFLSYEGAFTATNGSAAGLTSIDIGVSESSSTPVGHSLQLTGTGTSYEDFVWANPTANTYNELNNGQSFGGTSGGSSGDTGGTPTSSVHLTFGNPSGATNDPLLTENYLLVRDQYALSYNDTKSTANWVGWQLNDTWIGSTSRQNDFRADPDLPTGFFQVDQYDYSGSGFDRGHITPSADRTATITDNSNTFFMTNMIPQAPNNNRGVWASFENHLRTLLDGQDIYIYAGGRGIGGDGSNGFATTIGPGITVPEYTWKTALIVDSGETPDQVSSDDYTITIDIPNSQSVSGTSWQNWVVSVDDLELSTGYDFFAELPDSIESILEATGGSSGAGTGGASSNATVFISVLLYSCLGQVILTVILLGLVPVRILTVLSIQDKILANGTQMGDRRLKAFFFRIFKRSHHRPTLINQPLNHHHRLHSLK